jgi:hypothetical protein
MLDSGLEPVMLDDKTRAVAYMDTSAISLDEIVGDEFGVYTLNTARGYNHITQGPLTDELRRLERARDNYSWDDDKFQDAIERYLAMAGMQHKAVTLQGYSQGEWAQVIVYGEFDLAGSIKAMRDWWRGDVYLIALETLHIYTEADTGDTIERWLIDECMGGVILDDEYTIERCVKDNFTVTLAA